MIESRDGLNPRPIVASLLAILALSVGAAGCDDEVVDPETDLSAAEATAIALSADLAAGDAASEEALEEAEEVGQDGTRTVTYQRTRACSGGGEATIAGDIVATRAGETFSASFEGDWTAHACGTATATGLEISGTVAFAAERRVDGSEHSGEQSTSLEGTIEWSRANGTSGVCSISLVSVRARTAGSASRSVTGTVCGRAIDRAVDWNWTGGTA